MQQRRDQGGDVSAHTGARDLPAEQAPRHRGGVLALAQWPAYDLRWSSWVSASRINPSSASGVPQILEKPPESAHRDLLAESLADYQDAPGHHQCERYPSPGDRAFGSSTLPPEHGAPSHTPRRWLATPGHAHWADRTTTRQVARRQHADEAPDPEKAFPRSLARARLLFKIRRENRAVFRMSRTCCPVVTIRPTARSSRCSLLSLGKNRLRVI